jgi:hypothetical protein
MLVGFFLVKFEEDSGTDESNNVKMENYSFLCKL